MLKHNLSRTMRLRLGTTLPIMLIILPFALTLALTILTRADVALAEAQRAQARTQARLLAQSALAMAAVELRPQTGTLNGGTWSIAKTATPQMWLAEGIAPLRERRFHAALTLRNGAHGLEIVDTAQHIE